jgi:uncharacterized protein (DUF58 family)
VTWKPTVALVSAAGTAAALLVLAVTLHRPDYLALAAPIIAGLVINLARRPAGPLRATFYPSATTLLEDEPTTLRLRAQVAEGTELVTTRVRVGSLLALRGPLQATAAPAGTRVLINVPVVAQRWGRSRTGAAWVRACAAQGLLQRETRARDTGMKIVPLTAGFEAVEALPQVGSTLGSHRSRRVGDGTDLAGVRPFAPGDRLKRINWSVSLRTGQLHVTSTFSDLDATIMIVLDSSIDVDRDDADAPGGSLDVAVRAAAGLAEHYLRSGDRVGLLDHARPLRAIRPAAGRAHLDRIIDALLGVTPSPQAASDVPLPLLLNRIAPRALVMLLSPLLGAAHPGRALEIANSGRTVLVIDTLGTRPALPNRVADLAWRLQLLQREHDIDRLADRGIPVAPWRGPGSLDELLVRLRRAAAAPRMLR